MQLNLPENKQLSLAVETPEASYFEQRMAALGILPEFNSIAIWHGSGFDSEYKGENYLKQLPIFRETERGIEILVYDINRNKIKTLKDAQRSRADVKVVDKDYTITRLETPIIKANGDVQKYSKPSGEPSYPFFPPRLIAKFDKCRDWLKINPGKPLPKELRIQTLYLTEGFFKAFKADMHQINCVGLQSITTLREKSTNKIWEDITTLVTTAQVERLVFLTDGDFMNITGKDLTDGIDLYKRPAGFYNSAYTFYEITSQYSEVEKYFGHINTDTLAVEEKGKVVTPGPKGLDDLLCSRPDELHAIASEFNNFSIMAPGRVYPGTYISRINVTLGVGQVRKYILKNDVTDFYLFHLERRPQLKDIATFIFNGTTYRYDEKEGKCMIEVPGNAANYIRMGNDYYKHIVVPDAKKRKVKTLAGRAKGTIVDDHGKDFCKHIKKYDAPCVVPDHFNYHQVIDNCYNLYSTFNHETEEGDYSNTLEFIKHIWSEEICTHTDKETNETIAIPRFELGLDYLQLLYQRPAQMLPILCPVSRERQSGKTTLIDYLNTLYEGNAISIGNEDIEADFNAHWAGKLIISVDETKVDNGKVINKIKRLSTASSIILNAKGKDQAALPFFAKFILCSNHVEDFVKIDKEEIRFWVLKIPALPVIKPNFLQTLIDEIPAFLHFLSGRKMVSENKERHWFSTPLLHTDALRIVKENSLSGMEKRIRTEVQNMFEMCDMELIGIPLNELCKLLKNADGNYVQKTMKDMGYLTKSARYKYPRRTETIIPGENGSAPEYELGYEVVKGNTSHYEFLRKDFTKVAAMAGTAGNGSAGSIEKDDLPF